MRRETPTLKPSEALGGPLTALARVAIVLMVVSSWLSPHGCALPLAMVLSSNGAN